MSIFNAITNAAAGLIEAVVDGVVNIVQTAAELDVGTILVVVGVLIVGKVIYDKLSEKKK